jgi:hypothetical protein
MEPSLELLAIGSVADETARRLVRQTSPEVLEYKPSSVLPETQIAPPGSVTVYVARPGNPVLQEVREAVRDSSGGRDRKVVRKILRQIASRKPLSIEEAARRAISQPVLADLAYGSGTLCTSLFVDADEQVLVTALPYNGAALTPGQFTFIEHYCEDDDALDCLLVVQAPHLSAAEAAALKKVPPGLVHAAVAPNILMSRACGWLLLAALVAAEITIEWATFTLVKALDEKSVEHINPGAIDSLGPIGTARALLAIRRDLLQGKAGRILRAEHVDSRGNES